MSSRRQHVSPCKLATPRRLLKAGHREGSQETGSASCLNLSYLKFRGFCLMLINKICIATNVKELQHHSHREWAERVLLSMSGLFSSFKPKHFWKCPFPSTSWLSHFRPLDLKQLKAPFTSARLCGSALCFTCPCTWWFPKWWSLSVIQEIITHNNIQQKSLHRVHW